MSALEWREKAYAETLEGVQNGLETRRRVDPSFCLEDAERTLQQLYIQEGNDWGGRGMLQDAILAATIAAYELFIEAWKKEDREGRGLAEEKR